MLNPKHPVEKINWINVTQHESFIEKVHGRRFPDHQHWRQWVELYVPAFEKFRLLTTVGRLFVA